MLRCGRDDAQGYGDWNHPSSACGDDQADDAGGAIARMAECTAIKPNLLRPLQAMKHRLLARHKGCPYRQVPITIRHAMWAVTGSDCHAAPRCCGGARIGWPRTQVSMMIIGAPQSGQT